MEGTKSAQHFRLRVMWRNGVQWYLCRDICAIFGISQGAVNRLHPGFSWLCRDESYKRVKAVSFAGVCQLIALEGLVFSGEKLLVHLKEIPTIEPEGELFKRPTHVNQAVAYGLGRILLGLAAHATKPPSIADKRRKELDALRQAASGDIAGSPQRETGTSEAQKGAGSTA
jgi:hypothetical protein